jgi:hypothetical protein
VIDRSHFGTYYWGKMKYAKLCRRLASGIMVALLLSVLAAATAAAASISLTPGEGKVGDWVEINYAGEVAARFYFSGDKAEVGDKIGDQVRAYLFVTIDTFKVPARLEDGTHKEDVHGGEYYVYAAGASKEIVAIATFTVIKGEIQLEPEEGSVGDEVGISGDDLGPGQAITVKYGQDKIDIAGGDTATDGEGKFSCTVLIPDGVIGEHVVVVADQSGDKPEAIFTVKPKITLVPAQQTGGKPVQVSGTGFEAELPIKLTLDGNRVQTTPNSIETDLQGSFNCVFAAPLYENPTIKVEATDRLLNRAETQLTVLGGIRLGPPTTLTSPGNVGMEITIYGAGFASGAAIDISYNEGDEVVSQASVTADADGNFTILFTIPPSTAGSHIITATDGDITAATTFIMESAPPPVPVLKVPEAAGTAEEKARFDWSDVSDPSGVSYTLQVASDVDFNTLLVDKQGLSLSEYTLAEDEKLAPAGQKAYYWRVRAVDGASNESQWSMVGLFYVGFSRTASSAGVWYILYGLAALVLAGLVFWMYKRRKR